MSREVFSGTRDFLIYCKPLTTLTAGVQQPDPANGPALPEVHTASWWKNAFVAREDTGEGLGLEGSCLASPTPPPCAHVLCSSTSRLSSRAAGLARLHRAS